VHSVVSRAARVLAASLLPSRSRFGGATRDRIVPAKRYNPALCLAGARRERALPDSCPAVPGRHVDNR